MSGDRDDEDIFELTEDMASIPPPAPPMDEEGPEESRVERRVSKAPVPRSPFALIAKPRPRDRPFDSAIPTPRDVEAKRESSIPEKKKLKKTLSSSGGLSARTSWTSSGGSSARTSWTSPIVSVGGKHHLPKSDEPEEERDPPESEGSKAEGPLEKDAAIQPSEGKFAGPPARKSTGSWAGGSAWSPTNRSSGEFSRVSEHEVADSKDDESSPGGEGEVGDSTGGESSGVVEGQVGDSPGSESSPDGEGEVGDSPGGDREHDAEPDPAANTDEISMEMDDEELTTDVHPIIECEQDIQTVIESEFADSDDTTQVDVASETHDIPISVEEGIDVSSDEQLSVEELGTPDEVFDAGDEDLSGTQEIELDGVEDITDDVSSSGKPIDGDPIPEVTQEIELAEVEEIHSQTISGKLASLPPPTKARRPKMRRRRKRPKEWWADIFDDDYLALLPKVRKRNVRREADFIEKSLSIAKGGLLLDLACGSGRHAVTMARRGYRVVGVDLSLPMLARAGDLAQEADQKINFIHGDMRDLGFDRTFDGVYCLGTSFGYFDEKTNYKVLAGVARALKPKGTFLLEVANRDHVITTQPNLTWFEGAQAVCMEETNFNYLNSRLFLKRQIIVSGGARQLKHEVSLRLYSLHELGTMLHQAGFAVSQVAGHTATPGAFFGADSTQIIILATRR